MWLAEFSKRTKAVLRLRRDPSEANRIAWETFRNITRHIFTRERPKDIFMKYYHG